MPIKLPRSGPARTPTRPTVYEVPVVRGNVFNKHLDKIIRVCPSCFHHSPRPICARNTSSTTLVANGTLDSVVRPAQFRRQKSYRPVAGAQLATGMRDAAFWGTGRSGRTVAICAWTSGSWSLERGGRREGPLAADAATAERIPLIIVPRPAGRDLGHARVMHCETVRAIERTRRRSAVHLGLNRP